MQKKKNVSYNKKNRTYNIHRPVSYYLSDMYQLLLGIHRLSDVIDCFCIFAYVQRWNIILIIFIFPQKCRLLF